MLALFFVHVLLALFLFVGLESVLRQIFIAIWHRKISLKNAILLATAEFQSLKTEPSNKSTAKITRLRRISLVILSFLQELYYGDV
jgi:uncharacterized membrane protein